MRCQQCGIQTYPGHACCPRCAHEMAARHAWRQHVQMQIPAVVPRKNPWKAIVTGVISLCALAGGAYQAQRYVTPFLGQSVTQTAGKVFGSQVKQVDAALKAEQAGPDSILDAGQAAGGATLTAQAAQNPPVMSFAAEPAANAPVFNQTAEQAGFPEDVRAWIDHLKRTEAERKSLTKSQVSKATSLLGLLQGSETQAAGDEDTSKTKVSAASNASDEVKRTWSDLEQRFISVSAPPECVPIQVAYDRTLKETGNMAGGILVAIEDASSNPHAALSALNQMQGQSASRVDTPAKDADTLLAGIYSRYGVTRDFSISSDIGL